jgi:hypothetical protein
MMPGAQAPEHIASSRLQRATRHDRARAIDRDDDLSDSLAVHNRQIQLPLDVPPARTNPTVIGWYPLRPRAAQELTPIHIRGLLDPARVGDYRRDTLVQGRRCESATTP